LAIGTGVGDVCIDHGRIDFSVPHQRAHAIISFKGHNGASVSDDVICLADCLRRSSWERLGDEAGVDDIEQVLRNSRGALWSQAMRVVERQASRLVDWCCHINTIKRFDEVVVSGGAVCGMRGDALINCANQIIRGLGVTGVASGVRVVRSSFNSEFAGAMGACCYALGVVQQCEVTRSCG